MKLKGKLLAIKDAVTESVEEFTETAELNAEDYAKFYGASYTNFLNYIKKQKFTQMSAEFDEEEENKVSEFKIVIPIMSIKDKDIIFNDDCFGQKEKFNLTILKNLLYKARINYSISEDLSTMTLTEDVTERLSDRVSKLSENKDEYINKAKDMLESGNEIARTKTKELLKNLSNWADKNL